MRKHIRGLDHAVIAVRDLDTARDTFSRLGFTVAPRGFHTVGSQNHCMMFGADYLELLWLPPGLATRPFIADFLQQGEGLAALALATDDARSAHAELHKAGLSLGQQTRFSRPVELAQGSRNAEFLTFDITAEHAPAGRVFLCQHLTRDVVWQPELQRHANGATGIAAIAIVAAAMEPVAQAYARIFAGKPRVIEEGLLVETGSAPLAIVTESRLAKRLPGVRISARARPAMAALFVRVSDRGAAQRALREGGLHPLQMPDGSIAVGAAEAHGVAVVFG
jgi:catechol 2,3-dioxygenase-like lactoylglutathione lyase family enzyme